MKIYLDDRRSAPYGWRLVRWPSEAIKLLKENDVTEISLDHDLGNDSKGTGYDVLIWIERMVVIKNYHPPEIIIHTSNPSAKKKMELAVSAINRLSKKNENKYFFGV